MSHDPAHIITGINSKGLQIEEQILYRKANLNTSVTRTLLLSFEVVQGKPTIFVEEEREKYCITV